MSDFKKIRFEVIQATDNLNRIIYLQELVAMMTEQLELSTELQTRQA